MDSRQLQKLLRRVESLKDVKVSPKSTVASPFFIVSGNVFFYGEKYRFETEVDIQWFNNRDDVARLAAMILATFKRAEQRVGHALHG